MRTTGFIRLFLPPEAVKQQLSLYQIISFYAFMRKDQRNREPEMMSFWISLVPS